ncbi:TonB-dependent receptor [bacterium]|nr:TonB-dependent receptor [bacterium]
MTNVRVNSDLTSYYDFELPSEDITTETVTIVAKKPLIKKDATSSVRIATREDIENLPVRGVTSVIALQAGVVNDGGIRIRGSRTDEVGYYLDGVNVSDPVGDGRLVTIGADAVEEVSVETGGFSAEYGGANAGIVRSQLRTGGKEIHASFEYISDNIAFQNKDDFFDQEKRLGSYWYGNNTKSFVLSGPLFSNKIRFFYNMEYSFNRTSTRKGYDGINIGILADTENADKGEVIDFTYPAGVFKNDQDQTWSHAATVTFDLNPFSIRVGGTLSKAWWQSGSNGLTTLLQNRSLDNNTTDGNINIKLTHVLSPTMFYEVSGGYSMYEQEAMDEYLEDNFWAYGDSAANAAAGSPFVRTAKDYANVSQNMGPYRTPVPYNIMGQQFFRYNDIPGNYNKSERNSIFGKVDFSWLSNKHHTVKLGGEFRQYTIRRWSSGSQSDYARRLNDSAVDDKDTREGIILNAGVINYGYDILGNETDDGFYAPHKPVFAGFYLQDKIEYSDIILNIGLRYDYIDIDNKQMVDPTKPELSIGQTYQEYQLLENGWKDVDAYSAVSPRLSVSFPVTDRTVFHAGYGNYVQQPSLSEAYTGYHYQAYMIGNGNHFTTQVIGLSLKPTRKTHYEIGFRQQLTDFMAFELSAYYDDIKDQVQYSKVYVDSKSPYRDYNVKRNADFATTKGLEFTFNMRRYQRLAVNASLTFSDAKGTGANPESNNGIVGAPIEGRIFIPQYVSPLPFNRPLMGTIVMDYRFGKDDGPVDEFGINLLARFNTGHPYTRGTSSVPNAERGDARWRLAVEPLGSSLTPSNFQLDLKVDKTFRILDQLSANVYVKVLNLLGTKNVEDVFLRTGAADDDGYISDPELGGKLIEQYGPVYDDLYRALYIDYNGMYSNDRQILFGVRLEY